MVLQCIAAGSCFVFLFLVHRSPIAAAPEWVRWTMIVSVWAAVISTVYSGLIYMVVAGRLVRSSQ